MVPAARRGARAPLVHADSGGALAAAETLRRGGVVVVPTDTVYGLAARPERGDAVQAVYRAKDDPKGCTCRSWRRRWIRCVRSAWM